MIKEDTLIATVGLPRAGKTTWIEKMHDKHGWPVIEVDAFRHAIHGTHYNKAAEPLRTLLLRVIFISGDAPDIIAHIRNYMSLG